MTSTPHPAGNTPPTTPEHPAASPDDARATIRRLRAQGGTYRSIAGAAGLARGAAEHLIGALRCMYNHAAADGLLSEAENPAAREPKPRRLPSARMALPGERLAEITAVAASTGNDPALDSLIIRLHTETACRCGGTLALTPEDLDPGQCLIRLHEKAGQNAGSPFPRR